jgi:putative hydrolase of the HAD superfamily
VRTSTLSTPIKTLLLDLDDTLYPPDNGVWRVVSDRIDSYMTDRLGLSSEEAQRLRTLYLDTQGTTLRGLMRDFQIDPPAYLDYVHQLDYERLIQFDPALRHALEALPQQKVVFTNASADHARKVLAALHLTDLFSGLVDIVALDYANKPEPEAYTRALALIGESHASACLIADDRIRNLLPARAMGMMTVLVGSGPTDEVDARIDRLADLPSALPSLLDGGVRPDETRG